jgi:hypothetical protein
MPSLIKITKPLGKAVVAPTVRLPSNSRLSAEDRAALSAYTKEVETTIRGLADAVRELQEQLDGRSVG